MTNPFDAIHPWGTDSAHGNLGLAKREYFAAVAMQGVLNTYENPLTVSELSVKLADALIAELNKSNGSPTGDTVSDSSANQKALRVAVECLEKIMELTLTDAEGAELRKQNENNYRFAKGALERIREIQEGK